MLLIENHLDHFERGPENHDFFDYVLYLIGPGEIKTEPTALEKLKRIDKYY